VSEYLDGLGAASMALVVVWLGWGAAYRLGVRRAVLRERGRRQRREVI